MDQQIATLRAQLKDQQSQHRASELALRKRQFKVESEVENWVNKYDADMTEKQNEIDRIQEQYRDEQAQLAELEARLAALEFEYNIVMEEHRLERERRQAAEDEMQRMLKAALLVQSFWRAYKCRKAMKKSARKGSSKSKGKDGAKKGGSARTATPKKP